MTWTSLHKTKKLWSARFTRVVLRDLVILDLLNKLILWQRRLQRLNLVALATEDIPSGLVHILQEQNLDVLGLEWLELLWGTSMASQITTPA